MKYVSVMQPTFLPWIGYFALIDYADVFVFLDDVQLEKRSWQMRNYIKGGSGPVLLSVNIKTKPSRPLIYETQIADSNFETKLMRTIENLLRPAPYSDQAIEIVREGFDNCGSNLSLLNLIIIKKIMRLVGISTPTYLASELNVENHEKAVRHLKFTEYFGASCYLSAIGSAEYIRENNPFINNDIKLRFFNYDHPTYDQIGSKFLSHMSAIEAIAYVGAHDFLALARGGIKKPLTITEVFEGSNEEL